MGDKAGEAAESRYQEFSSDGIEWFCWVCAIFLGHEFRTNPTSNNPTIILATQDENQMPVNPPIVTPTIARLECHLMSCSFAPFPPETFVRHTMS